MKLNCKPGDLAVVIRHRGGAAVGDCRGLLLHVLHLAPTTTFKLPNGELSAPGNGTHWVVETVRPITVRTNQGRVYTTKYGISADANLRPIRDPGDDAVDETLTRLPAPVKELLA